MENSFLRVRAREEKCDNAFTNLTAAQSVGIIYKHRNEKDLQAILKIKEKLSVQSKKISIVGWVGTKEMPSYLITSEAGFFFNKNDLNLFLIPKNDYVKEFVKKDFDILLNFDVANSFVLNYISSLSHSKMKVGRMNEEMKSYNDFMISLEEKDVSIENIFNQTWHYLTTIRVK